MDNFSSTEMAAPAVVLVRTEPPLIKAFKGDVFAFDVVSMVTKFEALVIAISQQFSVVSFREKSLNVGLLCETAFFSCDCEL